MAPLQPPIREIDGTQISRVFLVLSILRCLKMVTNVGTKDVHFLGFVFPYTISKILAQ